MIEEHNISQAQFEQIDAYLLNQMSAAEKVAFEAQLSGNQQLQHEVNLQKELMMAVELGALKETISRIEAGHAEQSHLGSENGKNRLYFAIAASLVTVLAVSLWIFNRPDKNEALFAQHVHYEPGLPVPMSAQNTGQENTAYRFSDAMVDFKNENYQSAITKWNELLIFKPGNDTLTYFIGSAYFNSAEYNKASGYFSEVAGNNASVFQSKSEFYLVLCWLQLEEYEKIKALQFNASATYGAEIETIRNELKSW